MVDKVYVHRWWSLEQKSAWSFYMTYDKSKECLCILGRGRWQRLRDVENECIDGSRQRPVYKKFIIMMSSPTMIRITFWELHYKI